MVCLHGVEIGSIDLLNSKTYKLKNSRFAYFLKNPNRPWLRSFCLAWAFVWIEGKDGALAMNVLGVFRPILQDFC